MNSNQIILVGGGGHCKSCIDVIEVEGRYKVKGIIDLPKEFGKSTLGYKVIGNDDDLPKLANKGYSFLITLGHMGNPKRRVELFNIIKSNGGILPTVGSPKAQISKHAVISEGTILMHHSIVNADVKIGKNCIIQSGSVLGSSGFGYIRKKDGYEKISQIGNLIIEDNVEIGSLVAIDRGTIDDTLIKKGTKIDSLVKIAHNVVVGQNNIITSQVGIAGSSQTGDNVIMGGQSGVADHVTIGDNVIIAADAGVISDLPSGAFVSGSPAINHKREYKAKALMYKLPEMVDEVKKLKKELVNLKKEIKKDE